MNIDDTGHSHFAWFGGKILLKGTIRSLLSTLSSRLHCLCKEMGSLKYRLLLLSSCAMSNRQRHWGTPSAALRPARGQREAQDMVTVKILRFFSSHRVREQKKKKKSQVAFHFYFYFSVKKAPLLPWKRKAAHLWLLQAFPKKSAMKCWTAGLLLGTS